MHIVSSSPSPLPILAVLSPARPISPLMLADRLISLAQDADRAGYPDAATTLLAMAHEVLDERPLQ